MQNIAIFIDTTYFYHEWKRIVGRGFTIKDIELLLGYFTGEGIQLVATNFYRCFVLNKGESLPDGDLEFTRQLNRIPSVTFKHYINWEDPLKCQKCRKPMKCPSCGCANRMEEKKVDIALAVDVLSLATVGAFDIAYLISGDSDFVPLIKAVRRLGKPVINITGTNVDTELDGTCHTVIQLEKIVSCVLPENNGSDVLPDIEGVLVKLQKHISIPRLKPKGFSVLFKSIYEHMTKPSASMDLRNNKAPIRDLCAAKGHSVGHRPVERVLKELYKKGNGFSECMNAFEVSKLYLDTVVAYADQNNIDLSRSEKRSLKNLICGNITTHRGNV